MGFIVWRRWLLLASRHFLTCLTWTWVVFLGVKRAKQNKGGEVKWRLHSFGQKVNSSNFLHTQTLSRRFSNSTPRPPAPRPPPPSTRWLDSCCHRNRNYQKLNNIWMEGRERERERKRAVASVQKEWFLFIYFYFVMSFFSQKLRSHIQVMIQESTFARCIIFSIKWAHESKGMIADIWL